MEDEYDYQDDGYVEDDEPIHILFEDDEDRKTDHLPRDKVGIVKNENYGKKYLDRFGPDEC